MSTKKQRAIGICILIAVVSILVYLETPQGDHINKTLQVDSSTYISASPIELIALGIGIGVAIMGITMFWVAARDLINRRKKKKKGGKQ